MLTCAGGHCCNEAKDNQDVDGLHVWHQMFSLTKKKRERELPRCITLGYHWGVDLLVLLIMIACLTVTVTMRQAIKTLSGLCHVSCARTGMRKVLGTTKQGSPARPQTSSNTQA